MREAEQRIKNIREWMAGKQLDGLYLRRVSSFAWATCGAASYVNTASTHGDASLLITSHDQFLVTNNIEAPRLEKEERLKAQGWRFIHNPWYERIDQIGNLTRGMRLAADSNCTGAIDVSEDLARLRACLSPEEGDRFRSLGRLCAEAMDATVRSIRPGQTEFQIAAQLDAETRQRGAQPTVNLVAVDERIFWFRHPLPTAKTLERYAMLVLCGRFRGLVCSITRLVHFGPLPDEIQNKALAVATIDAALITATRPKRILGEVFQIAVEQYAQAGYPDEWQLHHQGGPAGYEPREYTALPGATEQVVSGQVYAWNPSITGTKSEDTILVGENGNEVLTAIPGWPVQKVELDGQVFERPAILVLD